MKLLEILYSTVFIGIISLLTYSNYQLRQDIKKYQAHIKELHISIRSTRMKASKVQKAIRKMK